MFIYTMFELIMPHSQEIFFTDRSEHTFSQQLLAQQVFFIFKHEKHPQNTLQRVQNSLTYASPPGTR